MVRTCDTVLGPVPADELGPTLMHEHLLVDTRSEGQKRSAAGAEPLTLGNYYLSRRNDDNPHCLLLDSVDDAVAELAHYESLGGRTIVEVTSIGIGRDPGGLVDIARQSGLNIVMGGGFYVHEWHTEQVHRSSEDELTELITRDCTEGVRLPDGASVPQGVIGEIGMSWPHTPCEVLVLRAAARAQSATGKVVIIHTGRDPLAPAMALEEAERAGADPSKVVLGHLDRTLDDPAAVVALARAGAFVSFDLFGNESSYYPYSSFAMPNDAGRLRLIKAVAEAGYADKIVVSHDIYSKTHLLRSGGEGYAHILRDVVPVMDRFGIDEDLCHRLLVSNPASALAGR